MTSADLIAIVITLTILIAVGVYLLHWLYRHSSKDQSFVRTGSGGERVVMGGGALVIPIALLQVCLQRSLQRVKIFLTRTESPKTQQRRAGI